MQFGIQMAAETENHMTSVERVFTYTQIDSEPGYNTDTQPPETWPTEGSLKLCDLSLAYLKGAPATLNNINISVAAKEKVGVVGRTGAGKSSLVAALFRLPEPEGSVRTISFLWSNFPFRCLFFLSKKKPLELRTRLFMAWWLTSPCDGQKGVRLQGPINDKYPTVI